MWPGMSFRADRITRFHVTFDPKVAPGEDSPFSTVIVPRSSADRSRAAPVYLKCIAASEAVADGSEFMLPPPVVETRASFAFLCQIGAVSDESTVASPSACIIESRN